MAPGFFGDDFFADGFFADGFLADGFLAAGFLAAVFWPAGRPLVETSSEAIAACSSASTAA